MTLLSLRRTSIAIAMALAGASVGAAPALASVTDGTSNTIQVAVTSAGQGIIAILIGLLH